MNLHQIASGVIGLLNPYIPATIYPSIGNVVDENGVPKPAYGPPVQVQVQTQALTHDDLAQLGGLSIQGTRMVVYLNGAWSGIIRATGKGGDKLIINGRTWIVEMVPEQWPGWTQLIVLEQVTAQE